MTEAIGALSGLPAVPAGGGVDLSALADLYRSQVSGGLLDAIGSSGTPSVADPTAATMTGAAASAQSARGADFASALGRGISELGNLDAVAQTKATAAATGDLTNVHDYVIAATQAQVATELTTTIRNKALDAFSEVMRMPL